MIASTIWHIMEHFLDKSPLFIFFFIYDLVQDYFPREACCELSRDPFFCDIYTEKRPAGSCIGYLPPRTCKYQFFSKTFRSTSSHHVMEGRLQKPVRTRAWIS